jgi:RnfABCDGE-type electron transport complex B subunit
MILADISQLWQQAWPAGLILLGLGFGFALVLLIASVKLMVVLDPKIEEVHAVLPHIECGACGFAGCASYAKAVVEKPDLIGRCAPGGPATAQKMGLVLNLQISDLGPAKRPIVHCRAHTSDKTYYATYQGIETCTAANAMANVQACKFGCLGYGDCVASCKFDALHMIDGLAAHDYHKCTGCGACARACPRNLITMVPFKYDNMITVGCSSRENGKNTRAMCQVGCIACGICAKHSEVFTVTDNLARVDYEKYQPDDKTLTAYNKCPTCVIVYRGTSAPEPREPAKRNVAVAT